MVEVMVMEEDMEVVMVMVEDMEVVMVVVMEVVITVILMLVDMKNIMPTHMEENM